MPKAPGSHNRRDDSAVVAPDPARAPSATSSKFWGVSWNKESRRWEAGYRDANGKRRNLGYFDTQEDAAHAVNAAIRRAGLEGKRRTNPVVDGQRGAACAQGERPRDVRKRRRDEASPPSTRPRLRLSIRRPHLTPAPPPRTPAPSRTGSRRRSRRAG